MIFNLQGMLFVAPVVIFS